MTNVHSPSRQPLDPKKIRPNTRIRVSYEGLAVEVNEGWIRVTRQGEEDVQQWFEDLDKVSVEILPPDVTPGCLLSAGGALWVVRKSNNKDSYRVQPVDLSTKLRTIPIEEFASRYPSAKVRFDPRSDNGSGSR